MKTRAKRKLDEDLLMAAECLEEQARLIQYYGSRIVPENYETKAKNLFRIAKRLRKMVGAPYGDA